MPVNSQTRTKLDKKSLVSRANGTSSLANLRSLVEALELESLTLTGDLVVTGSVTAGSIAGANTFADGAVGAPSIAFTGSLTTGLYQPSADAIGVTIGGALDFGFTANAFIAYGGSSISTNAITETTSANGVSIDGALIKDGSFIGKQATATATAAGLTTGLLSGTDQFVTVTSASAGDCICLPSDALCPIGTVIRGWVGANGFELRSLAADTTQTINGVTAGTTNEAAIPATTLFRVEKVASLTWILTAVDEAGAVVTAIIPDTI